MENNSQHEREQAKTKAESNGMVSVFVLFAQYHKLKLCSQDFLFSRKRMWGDPGNGCKWNETKIWFYQTS